jgi:ubiquinone/menaquinone biosynthesis C-methylase UbiE
MGSRQYFNRVASKWDNMQASLFTDKVREVAVGRANLQKGLTAADIGAGTGFITEELIKHDVKVIAVDQSVEMIDEMKKRFCPCYQIDYRTGESESLPIENEALDYVFANMYLHHVEDPPVAIREMVRILKPVGKIVITDADEHNYEFLRTEQQDRWLGFSRKDIIRWYKDVGLKNINVDCVGADCSLTSQNSGERVVITIFYALGEK